MIPIDSLAGLPLYYQQTVNGEHLDQMGHMNIRWYMAFYDEAAWHFFHSIGMTDEYFQANKAGGFALEQHIRYLAEVLPGDDISIRVGVLGRTLKRIHFMAFMINESRRVLASTLEVLGAHADLQVRRMSPYPPPIAAAIDQRVAQYQALNIRAPICGVMKP